MSAKPDLWMPFYIADYLADTQDLDAERHGAYMLLLMAAWMRAGRLPADERKLATIARSTPARWKVIRADVLAYFERDGDDLVQRRLAAEYARAVKVNEAQKANGKKGGRPKKQTQQKPTGFDSLNPNHNPNETPPPPQVFTNDSSSALGDYERAETDGARSANVIAWQAIRNGAGYGPGQAHTANDARLIAAVEAGVTAEQFAGVAAEAAQFNPTKPFGWVVATALGRHRDAASTHGATHADRPQRGRVGLADRHPRPAFDDDAIPGEAVRVHA